ncbi:hypothetical protein SANTM175S_00688 [Streptomyces antimycoticus]
MASLLRDFLMTRSENPVDLLNAATRLFGGSITTSPLAGLGSGDHELRGVAAHDFAVGFFASPLDVRVAAAPGRRSYFVNLGVSGEIAASRGALRATLDKATAGVVNPGDTQELRPLGSRTRFLGLRIDAALVDQEFAALTGHPPVSTVRFDFALDLARPKGRAVRLLVRSLIEQLDWGIPCSTVPSCNAANCGASSPPCSWRSRTPTPANCGTVLAQATRVSCAPPSPSSNRTSPSASVSVASPTPRSAARGPSAPRSVNGSGCLRWPTYATCGWLGSVRTSSPPPTPSG